ncbi:hypothetical protein [Petrimonas mucosa]|jgi:hypothetical protein|uniref:Uncharacterized protein n=1 Tax=Petrimonas mucosa TaxID=1642646 RepID=A0A1G4G3W6_9BACT|nr:hypothetical protein [Petrimonas mucosa]SCM55446.1 hypothetical protein ING2E5A_0373 [Petrimonas mucosa]SFU70192.1 hypothetical protein SAMN05216364_10764 [Porphyromonadaceae bacterium KHP3R9]
MKKGIDICIASLILLLFYSVEGRAQSGSYLIEKGSEYALWWSVGTYKVNRSKSIQELACVRGF